MEPSLIKKGPFKVIGYEIRTSLVNGQSMKEIPAFWQKVMQENLLEKIHDENEPSSCYGVCMDYKGEDQTFSYIIAHETSRSENVPEGVVVKEIPEAEYAVFKITGEMPKAIHEAFMRIYHDWIPESGYKHAGTPEFEEYDEEFTGDNPHMKIYIPVVKSE